MAVFPDKIVLKNSIDGDNLVKTQVATGGIYEISEGELVISRKPGRASIFTLDSFGGIVEVGDPKAVFSEKVTPSILLNFESTALDTPYYSNFTSDFPTTADKKFGTQSAVFNNSNLTPNADGLGFQNGQTPLIGVQKFTLQFWIKGSVGNWFSNPFNSGNNYLTVMGVGQYVRGPGAFIVYLDGGTTDTLNGGGSSTSETSNQSRGSVVLGINPGTSIAHDFLPSTGEIISSRSVTVLDDDWHHVNIQHEGSGVYSLFIDGELISRKIYNEAIDFNDAGTSGVVLPQEFRVGYIPSGQTGIDPLPGFNGYLDAISLHIGASLYTGESAFTVPIVAPSNTDVYNASTPNSIRSAYDTSIAPYANLANNSLLVWKTSSQSWETSTQPPANISNNTISDLSDVDLGTVSQILENYILKWDDVNDKFVPAINSFSTLDGISVATAATNQFLRYDATTFRWVNHSLTYTDIANRPLDVTDLNVNIGLNSLSNVSLDLANISTGQVLKWNGTNWVNDTSSFNLSGNSINDIGDVTASTNTINNALIWDGTNWVSKQIAYSYIINKPSSLSDFINDPGYISNINAQSIDDLNDVIVTNPQINEILIYDGSEWVNGLGPPADITLNLIGDLADVSNVPAANSGLGKALTITDCREFILDRANAPSGITERLVSDPTYGIAIEQTRDNDNSGAGLYADRDRGITLRADTGFVRIQGDPSVTDNIVRLRFDRGDSGAANNTGAYLEFVLNANMTQSRSYILPAEDGNVGDVLQTDGLGGLNWVNNPSTGPLGDLTDVDLGTVAPSNGQALVYDAVTNLWEPGTVSNVSLSTSSLGEMQDCEFPTVLTDGEILIYNNALNRFENKPPADIASALNVTLSSLSDVSLVTTPVDGMSLIYDAQSSAFINGFASFGGERSITKTYTNLLGNFLANRSDNVAVGFKAGLISKITFSTSSNTINLSGTRLRLYNNSADSIADTNRLVSVDPTPNDGVVAEIVCQSNIFEYTFTPMTNFYSANQIVYFNLAIPQAINNQITGPSQSFNFEIDFIALS